MTVEEMFKDAAIALGFIMAIVLFVVATISYFTSSKVYTPREAATECAAAGKRLGTFEFSYSHSTFDCIDPPAN